MQSIVQLSSLTFLDISSNNLQDISGKFNLNNEISELLSLKDLCIDENKVNDLSPVFGLYNLKSLSARNNSIEKLDFEFANLYYISNLVIDLKV